MFRTCLVVSVLLPAAGLLGASAEGSAQAESDVLLVALDHAHQVAEANSIRGAIRLDGESELGRRSMIGVAQKAGLSVGNYDETVRCDPDALPRLVCAMSDHVAVLVRFREATIEADRAEVVMQLWYMVPRSERENGPVDHQIDRVMLERREGTWVIERVENIVIT